MFFVKYPLPGRVKTRLGEQLGPKGATQIYKNFVLDLLDTVQNLNVTLKIFFNPPDAEEKFQQWLGKDYSYTVQKGDRLGQRMKNAFQHVFADNSSKAVIIGSDSPDLPADFLRRAFLSLESHDAVVGPASDGGYYLIGFTKASFLPEVFENISWSSNSVFSQTVSVLKQYKREVYLLPRWYDVDTLADLKALLLRSRNTDFEQSRTLSFLKREVMGRV